MSVNEKSLSRKRKIEVTEKHLEAISNQNILLIYPMFGAVQCRITGKITGRLRNRFRQFVFVPTFPFMTFAFSKHDVQNIEFADKGIVVTLGETPAPRKRRKKKVAPKVVGAEPGIDLNEPKPAEEAPMLNEDNIVVGGLYRVIKVPTKFGEDAEQFIGKIGKAKWANYRGVCLVFSDRSGYVFDFNCVEAANVPPKPSKPKRSFRDAPTIENVILGQFRYRFAKMPDWPHTSHLGRIGQTCEVSWNDKVGTCQIDFLDGDSAMCYLKHLEDIGG